MCENYDKSQREVLEKLRYIIFRKGGMQNLLICLADIVEDTVNKANEIDDVEYLRTLHRNIAKAREDYCSRYEESGNGS